MWKGGSWGESPSSFAAFGGFADGAEGDGGRVGFSYAKKHPQKIPKQNHHLF